jgi:DNA-binding GntR family transcriptional regulator
LDVHTQLRTMILRGELPPGSVIPQAAMARRLGVSRTPMREAFRLLQEEGLIEALPDQRPRVRAVDPEDLDAVYGARIMLESLAIGVTAHTVDEPDLERMRQALKLMEAHAETDNVDEWHRAHHEFHSVATRAVGPPLRRMIVSLGERSERYVRLAQLGAPGSWSRGREEHQKLLATLSDGDQAEATHLIARHLARTALNVLADVAPEHDPVTIRTALRTAGG